MLRLGLLGLLASLAFGQSSIVNPPINSPGTVIGPGQGVNVLSYGARCDGSTDDRVAIQAAITAAAGIGPVVFPYGRTCIISPVADRSKFLTLPANTNLKGRATLKVKNSVGPYVSVLYSDDCSRCLIEEITIDSNISNNPIANLAEITASPRWEVDFRAGSDITIQGITIQNTSATNNLNIDGSPIRVTDSRFVGVGDDPNHIVHDVSVLYLYGEQVIVTGNHFTGASRGAPSAYTAIETHSTDQTVVGNTILDMFNGMNITGAWNDTNFSATVSGNTIAGASSGITINSLKVTGVHEAGYGIDGVSVTGNTIQITQNDYSDPVWPNAQTSYGINLAVGNDLPAKNITISDNVIVFDLEAVDRASDFSNVGIGTTTIASGVTYSNLKVANNQIINSPVKGIGFSADAFDGLHITGNTIRDAGQSLDPDVGAVYKCPIFLLTSVGTLQGRVDNNLIIDDFATTRMTTAMFFGAAAAGGDFQVLNNNVSLLGTTKTAFVSYITLNDNNVRPLIRHTLNATNTLAWPAPTKTMAAGSVVFDVTTGAYSYLWAAGTAWTSAIYPRGGSVVDWFLGKVNVAGGSLDSAVGTAFRFGTFTGGTTFNPKVTLHTGNGVVIWNGATPPTLANGECAWTLTNNTTATLTCKGSDTTVRTATLTLAP